MYKSDKSLEIESKRQSQINSSVTPAIRKNDQKIGLKGLSFWIITRFGFVFL